MIFLVQKSLQVLESQWTSVLYSFSEEAILFYKIPLKSRSVLENSPKLFYVLTKFCSRGVHSRLQIPHLLKKYIQETLSNVLEKFFSSGPMCWKKFLSKLSVSFREIFPREFLFQKRALKVPPFREKTPQQAFFLNKRSLMAFSLEKCSLEAHFS